MSLKTLLGFGRRLLRAGKKESALPATGQQQKTNNLTLQNHHRLPDKN